jgi:hypothetical protein
MAYTRRCMEGVAKIPYKTLWILFPSPPPQLCPQLENKKRAKEKNEIQKL